MFRKAIKLISGYEYRNGGGIMIHSVIDIGSNSIRLSVYKNVGEGVINLFNDKIMAGLGGYVKKKKLSEKGIQRLIDSLIHHKNLIQNFEDIKSTSVFATASLRDLENYGEIKERVRIMTGFEIVLLSEKEEAMYSFIGATQSYDAASGALTDIGGGSTEMVYYKDRQITFSDSAKVGSLNLYHKFVERLIPTKEERKNMEKYIKEQLKKLELPEEPQEILCVVGGTGRASLRLYNEIYEKDPQNRVMDSKKFKNLIRRFEKMEVRETMNEILSIKADRVHTLVPGMILLNQVRKATGSDWYVVSLTGVREGYVYKKLLGGK